MRLISTALCAAGAALLSAGPASAADVTCGTTFYSGLFCMTADGLKTYNKDNSPLRFGRATHIASCGDKIAVLSGRKVYMFDGATWSPPVDIVGSFARKVACGPKGTLWTVGSRSAASWDGKGWKVHSRDQMFGEDSKKAGFLNHVAIGPKGNVLVLGSRMAAMYDGKAWKVFKEGQGFQQRTFLSGVAYDKAGTAYISTIRGLMMMKDGKWETVPGVRGTAFIAPAADGSIWVGGTRTVYQVKDGKLTAKNLKQIVRHGAVDGQGRLWVGTNYGVGMLGDSGLDLRQMANSTLQDNNVRYVATAGKGGALPEKKDQPTGSIKGRFEWSDGEEIKGAEVQVCGTPPSFFFKRGTKPCDNRPLTYNTKTDDSSKFEVKDVKASVYYIAIKPQGNSRWIRVSLGRRGQVLPGKTKNTGTIRLSVRNRK